MLRRSVLIWVIRFMHAATELLHVFTNIEVDCEHLGDHGMRLLARQNSLRQTKTDKCLHEKSKQNTQKIVGDKAAFYDKKLTAREGEGNKGSHSIGRLGDSL